ncbi:MAG: hypothetical protein L3J04_08560 [Robiginitomaculum sp.]|nr:hypothetical protein [Robiginitomaculum sp.]
MPVSKTRSILIQTCAAFTLAVAGCSTSAPVADTSAPNNAAIYAPKTVQQDFKKGQVLSFVVIDAKKGDAATAARNKYYETAFSLSTQFGLNRRMGFNVLAVPVGEFKPQFAVLYSWPSAAKERQFSAHPDWPAIKATRPNIWNELRVYNDVLKQDVTLTFDASKTYTLAAAWINPEHPNDYEKYLSGIQDAVTKSGGRFIYKMYNPTFEAHAAPQGAPDQVLLVEWDTPDGLDKFRKTAGFKANAKYLGSGTTLFELSVLSPVVG